MFITGGFAHCHVRTMFYRHQFVLQSSINLYQGAIKMVQLVHISYQCINNSNKSILSANDSGKFDKDITNSIYLKYNNKYYAATLNYSHYYCYYCCSEL